MQEPDCFFTVKKSAEVELKIKGSKFIGQVRTCKNELEAVKILDSIRKKYFDASHNCFAFRVGLGKNSQFRYSDDGEPSGTAGKPIYDQIEGKNLTNLIIIVTRYFGGIKLGTGGLTHAYSDTARESISKAGIKKEFIFSRLSMILDFSDYNVVEHLIRRRKAVIVESDFSDEVRLTAEIRRSEVDRLKRELVDITSGRIKFESDV
jgi:uncharacterized YigZ family protein